MIFSDATLTQMATDKPTDLELMKPILKLQNGSDVRGVAVEGVADEPVTLTPEYANRIVQAFVYGSAKKVAKKQVN